MKCLKLVGRAFWSDVLRCVVVVVVGGWSRFVVRRALSNDNDNNNNREVGDGACMCVCGGDCVIACVMGRGDTEMIHIEMGTHSL